jgi:hypothetical protein
LGSFGGGKGTLAIEAQERPVLGVMGFDPGEVGLGGLYGGELAGSKLTGEFGGG